MKWTKYIGRLSVLGSLVLAFACSYFNKVEERKAVVRVNDSYLYEDDIMALINENTSSEDSAVIVSNYITRWATQQLLIDRAKLNLAQEKQDKFNDLVENYKNELYTNAYTDAIVSRKLDSTFSDEEIDAYYENNKDNFKLNEDLVKLRYVNIGSKNTNLDVIKRWLIKFDKQAQKKLENSALQFKNYSLNDSVWVRSKSVFTKINLLNIEDRDQLLNRNNFMQLEDSLDVYLIYVKDVLLRNEQAPLEYARATIQQILLNRRKLDLQKELEKDITKDAIKNKQFEIFN